MLRVFRVQDSDGRGPFKPGFSHVWLDPIGGCELPAWIFEFPDLAARIREIRPHSGTAVRTREQINRWFSESELSRLRILGYRVVALDADEILAESDNQIVFRRDKPLAEDAEIIS